MEAATDYLSRIAEGITCVESGVHDVENAGSLRSLCLHGNLIARCCGTSNLVGLTELNLSANRIDCLKELASLPALRNLNLASNRLSHVDRFPSLPSLSRLNLAHNQISNISGLSVLEGGRLHSVDVRGNRLVHLQQLAVFAVMPHLQQLNIAGGTSPNEISHLPGLQAAVAAALPQVWP